MVGVVDIAVLGPLVVDGGTVSLSPRDRVVLAALVVRQGEEVSGEQLADALWGDDPPASWGKVVPGCVMRLRRVLGAGAIETTTNGYRLAVDAAEVDARRFERLVRRGYELLVVGEPDRAAHMFTEALAQWRGKALADLENWNPGRIEAARLDELRLDTEEALLDARMHAGLQWEVLGEAQARVAESPLRERRWALLAQAQYRSGRQGDALLTLRKARTMLNNELGLDPGPELAGLEQAVLRQDPSLMTGAAYTEPSAVCPYLGLVPYDVDDAEVFFGREDEIASCLRSLAEVCVLALAGPSGSGKSSLVRAGLAAVLRRNGRSVSVITPGAHPMDALTSVPAQGASQALAVDQCEEALLLCADADEQARFFTALSERAEHGLLVVAFRADRLGDISGFPDFARVVERNLHLLSPMTEAALRAVIERPARQAGMLLEPGLVDLLLREVESEPGALPLLSHALRQTWLRREGRTLTVAGYQETGGIRGAVAQTAEQVYEELSAERRPVLRDMLLRLVSPTPEGEPVRNRMPRRLIGTDPEHEHLIERLVDARLVTSDDGVVELAHEALARAWPRLRSWLDDDVEGQRIFRHLTMSSAGWESMDRPDSELYRGARLAQAVAWRRAASPDLTAPEREFLDASMARKASELQIAQARVRRLRWLTAGIAALAIVAVSAWLVAVDQRDRADERSTVAEARRAGSRALVERPYDRALLLAVEGVHLWDSPETRGNLLSAIQRSPLVAGVIRGSGARLMHFDVAPDGGRAAVVDNLEEVTTYDLGSRAAEARLRAEGTSYRAPTFTPDGTQLAVAWVNTGCWQGDCRDFGITFYDAENLSPGVTYYGLGAPAADIAFVPAGDLLAAIAPLPFFGPEDNIAVWQVGRSEEPVLRLNMFELGGDPRVTPDRDVQGWVAFSPDGSRLYASGAGPTVAFDVATGESVRSFGGVGALALSPDGAVIAIATEGNRVQLVDTGTGVRQAELVGHTGAVTDGAFSRDGSLFATVSNDQTALVWDARTGERMHRLEAHVGSIHAVDFGPGSQLYSAGADGSTIQWDLDRSAGLARQLVQPGLLAYQAEGIPLLSPLSSSVLIHGQAVDLLDIGSGVLTRLREDGDEISWAAYQPDGHQVATIGWDGSVQLWDVETGELLSEQPGRGSENWGAMAFTTDGKHLVVGDRDGRVSELDAGTLEPTGRTIDLDIHPVGLQVTHDGVIAVTADGVDLDEGTEVVFADLDGTQILRRLHVGSWGLRANFSPDGRLYAYGGFDGTVGVIDVGTGEIIRGSHEPIHDGPVTWVTFSPDNTTLVSLGFDGYVTVSDAGDAVPFARLQPGEPNLRSTAGYRDDGHTLVLAYEDGSVMSFETDSTAWEAHACAVAGRNLSSEEWREAFGDREYRTTCASQP